MRKSRRALRLAVKFVFPFAVAAITFTTAYGFWSAYRSARLYSEVKSAGRGWEDPLLRFDTKLGYAPIPGTQTWEVFPRGHRMPVHIDGRSFRAPEGAPEFDTLRRPFVLALGCSWTHGTGCRAEETFPERVADELHGTALNAAFAGYGLAHVLLTARDLLPEYRPDYVLAQYAPWLLERSLPGLAPENIAFSGLTPYFTEHDDGSFSVVSPPIDTPRNLLSVGRYAQGPKGVGEFLSFWARIGLPTMAYSDYQAFVSRVRRPRERPQPCDPGSSARLVGAVYAELAALAEQAGATLIIVVLGPGGAGPGGIDAEHLEALRGVHPAILVNAHDALYAGLDTPSAEAYEKAYCLWYGTPPELIDRHPNPHAHAIIAEEILKSIRIASGGHISSSR